MFYVHNPGGDLGEFWATSTANEYSMGLFGLFNLNHRVSVLTLDIL